MIKFINLSKSKPHQLFKKFYENALEKKQESIEVMAVSSYNSALNSVDSRFVNAKYLNDEDLIFFSNYDGPKSKQFSSNNKVSVLFYWNKIDTQIRISGKIKKTDPSFSNEHFKKRDKKKNALAISSNQSREISSYAAIKKQYEKVLNSKKIDLCKRPDYWGGYSITPYKFEFWQGNSARLNIRNVYFIKDNEWQNFILEP